MPSAAPEHAAAPAAAPPPVLKALWFDGTSSSGQRVLALIEPGPKGPRLTLAPLEPEALGLTLDSPDVKWPQTYGKADPKRRLTVNLGEHGSLQVANAAQWHRAYELAGGRRKMAERLQTGWKMLIGFTLACVLLLVAFFRYGTPWAAGQLARFVPLGWETAMTDGFLEQIEGQFFRPTKLSAQRQSDLKERFAAMLADIPERMQRYGGYQPLWRLEFRASFIGPNALAFPGGLVVVTDDMVELAQTKGLGDHALMGVIAHEIGHIVHRHSSRMLIEQGVLNATLSVALNDVSSMVALASTSLTVLSYSRDHEREADCFALALMRHQRIDPKGLAQLFAAMEGRAVSVEKNAPENTLENAPENASKNARSQGLDWLSSHPGTQGRIGMFASGQAMQCDMATGRLR